MKKTVIARHAAAFGICAPLMAMSMPAAANAAEQSEGIAEPVFRPRTSLSSAPFFWRHGR